MLPSVALEIQRRSGKEVYLQSPKHRNQPAYRGLQDLHRTSGLTIGLEDFKHTPGLEDFHPTPGLEDLYPTPGLEDLYPTPPN